MIFSEKIADLLNGENRMIEREHKKIQDLVEKTDSHGESMCFYTHDPSDGWKWEEIDYLRLRLWLNSLGLFTLRTSKGIYILWSFDDSMRSLIRQQVKTLSALCKMKGEK